MRKKILIVEDQEEIAELLQFVLERAGYATELARDGLQALGISGTFHPDLVLMDLMLPDAIGFSLCEHFVSGEERSVAVIILTGLSSEQARTIAASVGAVDFIAKPFSPRDLLLRLRQHLPAADERSLAGHLTATV